jgi:hypothetical protein
VLCPASKIFNLETHELGSNLPLKKKCPAISIQRAKFGRNRSKKKMAGNVSFFLAGTGALNSFTAIRVRAGTKKLALVLLGRYVLMAGTNLYYLCVCRILL